MAAAVACFFTGFTGFTAAAVTEFFGGRAFVTVAGAARGVRVLFSTRTGVQGSIVITFWNITGGLLFV
jgi:hypothetical protein